MEFLLSLRRHGIMDAGVLRAMDEVPREHFVTASHADIAYADQALPIACGQTISQPYVVAYMTEHLAVAPEHRVLEVGTGSGYQTALLAETVQSVLSIERHLELAEVARARLCRLGYTNVEIIVGDGTLGYLPMAPYDVILVSAAAPQVPQSLVAQLARDGRMVLPVGTRDLQELVLIRKEETGVRQVRLDGCAFVPLIGEQGFQE